MMRKFEKAIGFALMRLVSLIKPGFGTYVGIFFYRRWGMNFNGRPNYISASSWFDGGDYSRITLSQGCTVSSEVSFLTHDWALHTLAKSLGHVTDAPLGIHEDIYIGEYCFIGRGCIILPGTVIERGSLIGAGSVVRGNIKEYSLVLGNPAKVVGDSRKYLEKKSGLN